MGNNALAVNGDTVDGYRSQIHITTHGSDWYWAVTAIMGATTIAIVAHSFTKARSDRVFHYICAGLNMVAFIAYFTMASNLGWASIFVEFMRSSHLVRGTTREIFYVRYIDWVITTPLLLLDILLTAGLPWPTILVTILLDEVMIITGLVGALVKSRYKWGYFAFGCMALIGVAWHIAVIGRRHANFLGKDIGRVYLMTSVWTMALWFIYPIAWGLSEGGNVISPDGEAVFYGILDILAKPVFSAILLFGHRNIAVSRLGLSIRDFDAPLVHGGAANTEKHNGAGIHNGATNGATNGTTNGATHHNGVMHNGNTATPNVAAAHDATMATA